MKYQTPVRTPPKEKIVATYTAVGSGWVLATDWLSSRVLVQKWANEAQVLLVWTLVLFTAALLYWLLQRDNNAIIKSERDKQKAYEKTVSSWIELLDMRHKETKDHTLRVARMAENFAIAWGLSHEEVESIRQGAILHDIGKLSVPDAILKKPGPLSAEEWAIMKKHPESARQFLRNMDYLTPACRDIPVYHHERWDGTGYPEGLSGTQIPFAARLFAIVDVWESMIQQRPYKPPIKEETVLEHIKNGAGSHFDPDLAHFFIDNYQYIKSYGDLTPTSSSGYES